MMNYLGQITASKSNFRRFPRALDGGSISVFGVEFVLPPFLNVKSGCASYPSQRYQLSSYHSWSTLNQLSMKPTCAGTVVKFSGPNEEPKNMVFLLSVVVGGQ